MGVGVIYPVLNTWYTKLLPRLLNKLHKDSFFKRREVFTSILLDQLICSTFYTFSYFYGINLLEHFDTEKAMENAHKHFVPVVLLDCCFFPIINIINFTYVPTQYRMLYLNFFGVLWNTFLAYRNQLNRQAKSQQIVLLTKET